MRVLPRRGCVWRGAGELRRSFGRGARPRGDGCAGAASGFSPPSVSCSSAPAWRSSPRCGRRRRRPTSRPGSRGAGKGGVTRDLPAGAEVEFSEDLVHVHADGAHGDAEGAGDLAVGQAVGHEMAHLPLAGQRATGAAPDAAAAATAPADSRSMARLACWRVTSSESACPARRAALSSPVGGARGWPRGRPRAPCISRTPRAAATVLSTSDGSARARLDQPDALRERGSQLAGEARRQRR